MRLSDIDKNGSRIIEGMLDNPGAQDSPVAQAIIRRILLQRTDLLGKYGPEKVGAAVDEVADFVGDVDEIGSSDVSGWIRHVEQMLGNMEEGVAEGLGKTIKRGMAGWGAFDKDKPADVVKRVRGQDTDTLKGLSNRGSTGKGSPAELQQKAISRELKKRGEQGVAEGDDIQYHQTSGTKAGHTISSRKLSNKPQASKSDVTLQSGSMHHRGKSYNFPKGTLFAQLPGGIFAQHPSVPETHPGFGHLIRKSEDNIRAIHSALTGEQGVAEGYNDLGPEYGGAYVNGRSDDARMTERLTRQAKAAAAKAGKTFSTSAEYRKWHARQKEKQGVAEVSKATLDQYVPKAVDAHGHADFSARMSKDDPTKRSYHVDQKRTAEKRRQGISRALDRMSKMEGAAEGTGSVNVGDDVIITGAVKYKGATGVVDSMGRDGNFIVVNLYNHGKQSFQSTDVSPNDYAGSDEEESEMQRREMGESALSKAVGNFKNKAVVEASNPEYDDEAGMAESNLRTMARAVDGLLKTIENDDNLPEWAQEKIAKAEMMLVSVWDYLQSQKEQGIDPKVIGESVKGHTVEAHGVKGMNNKAWRKTFKNAEQAYAWAEKNDAEVKGTRDLEAAKTGNLSPAVKEGAKVDRMVKHITKSEKAAGKSSAEAEDIAWATANKRGMLDNKNKKTESTKARASKKY